MKKTKSLVSLLAVILVTGSSLLASCGDAVSSTQESTSTSEESSEIVSSSSEDEYPAATVSLRTSSAIEVEVGATARIAGSVTTDADDATLTISVEDPSVVALPSKTTGAASYTITGLAEGTTTVTLAATVNPTAYVTVQVTVIAARPALASMIDTISNYSNYTIVTEGSYPSSSGTTIPYTSKLECTENMLVSGIDLGNYGTYTSNYSSNTTGESLWGIFAADGYCSYIYENSLGHLDTSSVARLKGNDGYLTADHIGGNHYKSMSSMNDYFNGLQALNSSLFTSEKSDDNVYEIAGSSSDMNSTYAECMLMSIMDQTAYYYAYLAAADASGSAYYYDMAEAVTTTVTILDVDEVQFDFEVNYGGNIISSTATIQDVGTTEIDLLSSDMLTDISSVTSIPAPELDSRLELVVDAIAGNDYMVTGSYYLTSASSVNFTAYDYYTEDYYVAYMLDQTNYDILAQALSEDDLNEFTEIYYKDADGHLSGAYVTYAYDENNNFTATIDTSSATQYTGNTADDLYEALGYLSSTGLFTEDALAQLSDYEQFFTSIGSGFWTTGETLTRQYGEAIGILSQIDRYYPDRLGTDVFGIVPTFNDNYTAVESFTLYYGYDEEGTGSYGVYSWPYTNVGGAASSCLINDQYLTMVGGSDTEEDSDEDSEIATFNPDFRLAR